MALSGWYDRQTLDWTTSDDVVEALGRLSGSNEETVRAR